LAATICPAPRASAACPRSPDARLASRQGGNPRPAGNADAGCVVGEWFLSVSSSHRRRTQYDCSVRPWPIYHSAVAKLRSITDRSVQTFTEKNVDAHTHRPCSVYVLLVCIYRTVSASCIYMWSPPDMGAALSRRLVRRHGRPGSWRRCRARRRATHVGARDASPTRTVSALGVYCQLYIAGDRLLELEGDRVRGRYRSMACVLIHPTSRLVRTYQTGRQPSQFICLKRYKTTNSSYYLPIKM
jgi:hypothetical protein